MIVLGSGGHTAEMMNFLRTIDLNVYTPRCYIVANTDVGVNGSKAKAASFESEFQQGSYSVLTIPRSREVGQSWITTIFSTLKALTASVYVVWKERPELILTNGPGTCVPVCMAAYPLRMIRWPVTLVFAESIACVGHLSLSARLLYFFVDRLFVQWEPLARRYPRAQYTGRLGTRDTPQKLPKKESDEGGVFVTVGSTDFDALMAVIDRPQFLEFLRELGYRRLRIQQGRGTFEPQHWNSPPDGLEVESFRFTPSLADELKSASLVISHAGAGSILEALTLQKRLVVVPNETLMNNHQLELAYQMQDLGFSVCAKLSGQGEESLEAVIRKCRDLTPKPFPTSESDLFRTYLNDEMNVQSNVQE